MESCSRSVPRPESPGGLPNAQGAGPDCLTEAFSIAATDPGSPHARPQPSERPLRLPLPGHALSAPPARRAASPVGLDPAIIADRRREERPTLSIYRSAILHWQSLEALCLIRNVSPGGMMGRILVDLPVGTDIIVEMRSGHEIPGRIVWARDREVGVEFADAIEVQQVVNGAHRVRRSWRQRMPRVHAPCPATLLTADGRQTVSLLDLSQGGAKIEGDLLRPGADVTLATKGLDPHRGTIRWTRGGRAGIAFLRAIPFDTLALWALQRQTEMGRIDAAQVPYAQLGNAAW